MKISTLLLFLVVVPSGCGASYSAPPATATNPLVGNPTPARGQWVLNLVHSTNTPPLLATVNLDVENSNGTLTIVNCIEEDDGHANVPCFGTASDTGYGTDNQTFSGTIFVCGFIGTSCPAGAPINEKFTFSGTVGTGGKVITNGTYAGSSAGSFSGTWYPPFSGTYAGTVGSIGPNLQVTLNVSQNNTFSLQINGQGVENGTLAALSITSENPPPPTQLQANTDYSVVVGSVFYGGGTAAAPQLAPGSPFSITAVAQDATEEFITVSVFDPIHGDVKTGNLARQ